MKKDKSKILGIGCIIFAVFMIVISGIQYLNKEKNQRKNGMTASFTNRLQTIILMMRITASVSRKQRQLQRQPKKNWTIT